MLTFSTADVEPGATAKEVEDEVVTLLAIVVLGCCAASWC